MDARRQITAMPHPLDLFTQVSAVWAGLTGTPWWAVLCMTVLGILRICLPVITLFAGTRMRLGERRTHIEHLRAMIESLDAAERAGTYLEAMRILHTPDPLPPLEPPYPSGGGGTTT